MTIRAVALTVCLALPGMPASAEDIAPDLSLATRDLDPAALDAARRYFAMPAMQGLSAMRHAPAAIARNVESNLPEGAMTPAQRDAFLAIVTEEFAALKAEHDETTVRVLAHVYTAEELEALIAFERTVLGRRIAEKRPVYSVLVKDATASLRRDALARVMARFTGQLMEPTE